MTSSAFTKATWCVIPHYGAVALTQSAVRQVGRELPHENILVVDNGLDYQPVGSETVVRPQENLGWLRGSNLGLQRAFVDGAQNVVLLNNDVELSSGFFAGLCEAAESLPNVGIVAPCYDGPFRSQNRYWTGPVDGFIPDAVEEKVRLVDGTAALVRHRAYAAVGGMDELRFGRHGWGGITDWCHRMISDDFQVLVTRRAYVHHHQGVSAHAASATYFKDATTELEHGMRQLYGRRWRTILGYVTDGTGDPSVRSRFKARIARGAR